MSVAGFAHGFGGEFLICNRDSCLTDQEQLEMAAGGSERSVEMDLIAAENYYSN